ncbi:MAG TPA: hypothetical protein PKY59_06930 [Pyrinomonadaceae bacterium]|nr:hypothetical protein [Pyrinomonadaceae bacterium]
MEEEKDYYEKLEDAKKEYEEESANLLQIISKREEMIGLLKIAKPEKIKEIQELIPRLDKSIALTEEMLESMSNHIKLLESAIKQAEELDAKCDIIQKELIEYIERENPEKLEEVKAMLFGEGSSH